ncbi:multidrug-resistance type transporter aminotriazole resistance [Neonectria magnoliae]|uniref:Multidrug-resistance type transporter aminotriazole resistance n=1 Tax=Neonectria magnoliae TaxID=2732573 RepID=A0ABR1IEK9_9HYPO
MAPTPKTNLPAKAEVDALSQIISDVESNKQPKENIYPADALSTPRQILFVGTLCTSMIFNQAGLGNTLTTVGVIGESFGITNPGQLSWLIAGYSLTIGTFILIGGRLGDEFGDKRICWKAARKDPRFIAYLAGSILAAIRPADSIYWTYYFFSVLIITVGMDTSFPAATIIFSNAVPQQYQGMGASVVLTIVNYSISIGLGMAGAVETHINHGGKTKSDELLGYRGGLWLGVGLAGLGLVLSLIYVAKGHWGKKSHD